MNRRTLLQALPATVLTFAKPLRAATNKPLRGVFPIAQSPFTEADKLDLDVLVEQLRFIDRGGVQGFVWPQIASEWSTLSKEERLAGTEAICAAGKKLKPTIVIGVQSPDLATAQEYARHAAKQGADALISLPPPNQPDPKAILDYYKAIGQVTELPLIVQAVGNLSVDQVVEISKAAPTVRAVKDEAGEPLLRIAEFQKKAGDRLLIFTGTHGRTMIDELMRGFAGTMPAASFADIYASAWELWQAGKHRDAADMFGHASMLIQEISTYGLESMKYLLCLRGVFKTYKVRDKSGTGRPPLDDTTKQVLRDMLDLTKPYLRA